MDGVPETGSNGRANATESGVGSREEDSAKSTEPRAVFGAIMGSFHPSAGTQAPSRRDTRLYERKMTAAEASWGRAIHLATANKKDSFTQQEHTDSEGEREQRETLRTLVCSDN